MRNAIRFLHTKKPEDISHVFRFRNRSMAECHGSITRRHYNSRLRKVLIRSLSCPALKNS